MICGGNSHDLVYFLLHPCSPYYVLQLVEMMNMHNHELVLVLVASHILRCIGKFGWYKCTFFWGRCGRCREMT